MKYSCLMKKHLLKNNIKRINIKIIQLLAKLYYFLYFFKIYEQLAKNVKIWQYIIYLYTKEKGRIKKILPFSFKRREKYAKRTIK